MRNYYLQNITIKFERNASPQKVKAIIKEKQNEFLAQHEFRSIRFVIDVDPQ